jgi:hypothetical protein
VFQGVFIVSDGGRRRVEVYNVILETDNLPLVNLLCSDAGVEV